MRRTKHIVSITAIVLFFLVFGLAVWMSLPDVLPRIGPSRSNFERLRPGMSLAEVESILGPAGPSISSIRQLQLDLDNKSLNEPHEAYYVWKGTDGYCRVWVVEEKVTRLEFDSALSFPGN